MATCVYCVRTDPPCGFDREHVIPEALGLFRNGLTLANSEVCRDCNGHFGATLDHFLARDSAEALFRFRYRLKDPAEVGGMFTERVRVRLPDDGSEYGGMYLGLAPPGEGGTEPLLVMVPQIAYKRGDGTGWEYVTEDDLRRNPAIAERMVGERGRLRIAWYETDQTKDRIFALLAERGITVTRETEIGLPRAFVEGGRIVVEVERRFDAALARAVAKIAFNYLAKMQGAAFALQAGFDPVRRFVRDGDGEAVGFVQPHVGPGVGGMQGKPAPRCHSVSLYWDQDRRAILSGVSPFNALAYVVRLCADFRGVWREILSGHVFDLERFEARAFKRTPIIPPDQTTF